ncbi:MAG: large conductance mechanosensitive channel protein MscL [Dehalococcoidia bacterium]|nr:large conductance mechanosensitive channel protein MscL [Dehalococcoidia bacterium]
MIGEFRQFVLRGNVIDLAVGIVIGVAFGAVVTSFVENLLTPLIAAIVGEPDFSALSVEVNGSVLEYGLFLNALISFVVVAAAIFFFVVKPVNALVERSRRGDTPADPTTKRCPECRMDIPLDASRCAFCAVPVGAA